MSTSSTALSRAHTLPEDRAAEARVTDRLFRRWREEGDLRARDEIFERHLPIARRLAGRYWNAFEPFEDLFQVASLGLFAAIERFDPDRGVAFPVFAIPTVLGELKRYFRDTGWSAHVPRRAQELARLVEKASRELTANSRRAPRVSELAEYLEISTEDVLTGLHAATAHHSVSLDAPVTTSSAEEVSSLGESLGCEDERFALVETATALSSAARSLSLAERRALALRLEADLKQSEIAELLGCSQMQVSRLLRSGAEKLRSVRPA
ncbi:MAG TPA: sigma-70 family RNA polymerase sigma factor [Solirubrobacteraceae bacterium]|jgi:RNA polymerase sigma-B factor|nr:sigma-70 family RNA polymerase sigma factor [Solirubrobacteraceae bacterium]